MNRRRFLRSSALWLPVAFAIPARAVNPFARPSSVAAMTKRSSRYSASAVAFDGSTYLTRGGALTGVAGSNKYILSFWFKIASGDGTERFLMRELGGYLEVSLTTGNRPKADWGQYLQTSEVLAGSGWHHVIYSVNATVGQSYLDGVDSGSSAVADTTIDFTQTNWGIGANHVGASPFTGSTADLYFAPGQSLDLTVAANLAKFISAGKPVNLGTDGSAPTGTVPAVFLSGNASAFATNKGSGGGMSTTGTLTNDSNGP